MSSSRTITAALSVALALGLGAAAGRARASVRSGAAAAGGHVLERDADIAREEPGPHDGLGRTTGYRFFEHAAGLQFSFRKRALHPGASIGYHRQTEDEVYYVLSGTGRMAIDGKPFDVKPGDAVLTRPGSSHGLEQTGQDDLTVVIVFPVEPRAGG